MFFKELLNNSIEVQLKVYTKSNQCVPISLIYHLMVTSEQASPHKRWC